jgi:urea ABC transporter permease protein UrtC
MTEPMITSVQEEGSPRRPFLSVPLLGPARTRTGLFVAAFSLLLLVLVPRLFPPGLDARSQQNWLDLFAKFMAMAILALSVDLVWGYTGLLSLGQGVFFGIGAYMIAYCLTLHKAAEDARPRKTDGEPVTVVLHYEGEFPSPKAIYVNDGKYRIESIQYRVIKPSAPGLKATISKLPAASLDPDTAEQIHNGTLDMAGPVGQQQPLELKGDVPEEKILRRLEQEGDRLYMDVTGEGSKGAGEFTVVLIPEIDEYMKPGEVPPQFMQYTGYAPNDPNYVPPTGLVFIAPLGNEGVAIAASLLLPALVAGLFGWVIFRLRVRGVYFALVTQAFLMAVFLLVRNQQRFTGGVVGIKNMSSLVLFGKSFDSAEHVRSTVYLVAAALVVSYFLCALLVRSKFGKVLTAIQDNENRVLALGYNTALYKTAVFSFAGLLAGLAGGLYVLANHPVCDTVYLSVPFSIECVIWVAIGGRGGLFGAVLGALLVGFGQYYVSSALPDFWPIVLGLLFIITVLFLPRGLSPAAGPGALLGLLGGIFLVVYLENFPVTLAGILKEPRYVLDIVDQFKGFQVTEHTRIFAGFRGAGRVFIGCPIILFSVFLPKLLTKLVRWLTRRVSISLPVQTKPVSPVAG